MLKALKIRLYPNKNIELQINKLFEDIILSIHVVLTKNYKKTK